MTRHTALPSLVVQAIYQAFVDQALGSDRLERRGEYASALKLGLAVTIHHFNYVNKAIPSRLGMDLPSCEDMRRLVAPYAHCRLKSDISPPQQTKHA